MPPALPFEVIRKIITLNLDPLEESDEGRSIMLRNSLDQMRLLGYSRVNWIWKAVAEELLFQYVTINHRTFPSFGRAVLARAHCYTCRVLIVSWIRFTRAAWSCLESILGALNNIEQNLMLVFSGCINVDPNGLIVPGMTHLFNGVQRRKPLKLLIW